MEIKDAIKISQILSQAPEERIPMILSVLRKADVTIEGLEELEEWRLYKDAAQLIDIEEFKAALFKAFPDDGSDNEVIKIPATDFTEFLRKRKLKPTPTKRMLAKKGILRTNEEGEKTNYTETAWIEGKTIRCVAIFKAAK